jgi:hypothetical protein
MRKPQVKGKSRKRYIAAALLAIAALAVLSGCKSSARDSAAKASASAAVSAELNSPQGKAAKALAIRCVDKSRTIRKLEACLVPKGHEAALKSCVSAGAGKALFSKKYRKTWERVTVPQCVLDNR